MKSKIYNLIILDESGSMQCICDQTISGCNETINTIRCAQQKYAETQDHRVSIYVFQDSCVPSRYLMTNVPAYSVDHISRRDYEPMGMTPLYDALGRTLTELRAVTKNDPTAIANVTIITDGMENASRRYNREDVAKMIEGLKEAGWNFNFIGANIDVKGTAASLNIDNSMEFQQDARGTQAMFERERSSRMRWLDRSNEVLASSAPIRSEEDRKNFIQRMKETVTSYFEDED